MPHGYFGPPGDDYESICEGLDDHYGDGLIGGSSPFGFNLCDFIVWMFAGAAAVGTVAVTAFAATSNDAGSPYHQQASRYDIYEYRLPVYEIPDFEIPNLDNFQFPF